MFSSKSKLNNGDDSPSTSLPYSAKDLFCLHFLVKLFWTLFLGTSLIYLSGCGSKKSPPQTALQKAQQLIQDGDNENALMLMELALVESPEDSSLLELFAFTSNEEGQYEQAAQSFEKLVALQPDSPEYALYAGSSYAKAKNLSKAISLYESYMLEMPEDTAAYSKLADLYLEDGKLTLAENAYLKIYERQPRPQTALTLARLYQDAQKLDEAAAWFERALEIKGPHHEKALLGLLEIQEKKKNFKAIQDLVLKLDESYPGAIDLSPLKSIRKELKAWLKTQKKNEPVNQQAEETASASSSSSSKSENLTAVVSSQSNIEIINAPQLGIHKTGSSKEDAIFEILNSSDDTSSTDKVSETHMSKEDAILAILGDDDGYTIENTRSEKESLFESKEITINEETKTQEDSGTTNKEENPEIDIPMAMKEAQNHRNMMDLQAAIQLYKKILIQNNDYKQAWYELSECYYEQENYPWAEACALEAIRRNPDNLDYHLHFLKVARKTQNDDRYLRELINAHQHFPKSPEIMLALARGYKNIQGSKRNAIILYDKFIHAAPNHPEINAAIAERTELEK